MDWVTGGFVVDWTNDSPLARQASERDGDVADLRLLEGGVLVLRIKADGRLVYCAPHTWKTVEPAAPPRRRPDPFRATGQG